MRKNNNNNKPAEFRGLTVEVRNGDFAWALRQFKKKVQESRILQEVREREFYDKPSVKRKKAAAAARSRWMKRVAREENLVLYTKRKGKKG